MVELMVLSAFCALVGLGCLGAVAWALLGAEDVGVERIFLLLVWLILGLLFLGMSAWIARQGPSRDLGRNPSEAKAPGKEGVSAQQKKAAREEVQKPAS